MKKHVRYLQDILMPVNSNQLIRRSLILPNAALKRKIIMSINVTTLFLILGCMQISAKSVSQTISYKSNAASIANVFSVVEAQTGYYVVYNAKIIKSVAPVTISANNMPLSEFLNRILKPLSLNIRLAKKLSLLLSRLTIAIQ
ncbi:MAG TPA: hypothetical protein VNQ55_06835 [Parapedobacter sp.]|nr:hypothetical protein [Parapedobacter sp.]